MEASKQQTVSTLRDTHELLLNLVAHADSVLSLVENTESSISGLSVEREDLPKVKEEILVDTSIPNELNELIHKVTLRLGDIQRSTHTIQEYIGILN